jgi:hypothetical protein
MADVERLELDAKRENLLDVVLDKLHKAGKASTILCYFEKKSNRLFKYSLLYKYL